MSISLEKKQPTGEQIRQRFEEVYHKWLKPPYFTPPFDTSMLDAVKKALLEKPVLFLNREDICLIPYLLVGTSVLTDRILHCSDFTVQDLLDIFTGTGDMYERYLSLENINNEIVLIKGISCLTNKEKENCISRVIENIHSLGKICYFYDDCSKNVFCRDYPSLANRYSLCVFTKNKYIDSGDNKKIISVPTDSISSDNKDDKKSIKVDKLPKISKSPNNIKVSVSTLSELDINTLIRELSSPKTGYDTVHKVRELAKKYNLSNLNFYGITSTKRARELVKSYLKELKEAQKG